MIAGGRLKNEIRRWYLHAQRLFHVVVGLAFLVLAAAGAWVSFGEWQDYLRTPSAGLWRFGILAGFTVMLLVFCLYSFLKARSIR